jgi:uncharacterized protein YndB with AHSA1/START domain
MPSSPDEPLTGIHETIQIAATPTAVFDCFFSANALRVWWQAARAITTPVPFGVFAIEWAPTVHQDDILGTLGGVLHGTIVEARRGHGFLVAEAYWVPPAGAPLGPMALEVRLKAVDGGCRVHVRQEGFEPSPRWERYYQVVERGWQVSLAGLKRYAESAPS